MGWIKVDQTLPDHEKTYLLAEFLEMDRPQVIGYLVNLWTWAIDKAPSGVLSQSNSRIADACGWNGAAEPFVTALIHAGFIDDDYMGGERTIHGWDEYAGALLMKRNANKKRAAAFREKQKMADKK